MRAIVLAALLLSTAASAYDPVADTRKIMAGTVTTTSIKNEYLSGKRDGTAPFQGALKAYKAVRAAEVPAPAPVPVPIPTPTPVPAPTPAGGWVDSPTLNGGPDFIQPFDVNLGLGKSWGTGAIPGLEPGGDQGAFRFTCGGDGQLNHDDMLIFPNQPGKAHGHQYWGNFLTNSNPDEERLKTGRSNCNSGPYPLNLSSYWMPWLEDDQGFVRPPDYVSGYYKRNPLNSAGCTGPTAEGICVGLPNRIRYFTGWDFTKPDEPAKGAFWYCVPGTGLHYGNLDDLFNSGCAVGAEMVGNTIGFSCWDGKHLDSPDHRSHMAFSVRDVATGRPKCPTTHPYRLPTQENKATWIVTADMIGTRADGSKYSRVKLSSDHMKTNAKPGETLHADYEELWDARAKAMWVGNCVDKGLNCSGGDLGNGKQLIGASQPTYGMRNPTPRVAKPAT